MQPILIPNAPATKLLKGIAKANLNIKTAPILDRVASSYNASNKKTVTIYNT